MILIQTFARAAGPTILFQVKKGVARTAPIFFERIQLPRFRFGLMKSNPSYNIRFSEPKINP